jgi:hypothetical protein
MVDKLSKPLTTQLNVRLDEDTRKALEYEAALVKSTPSQVAREGIDKELSLRRQSRGTGYTPSQFHYINTQLS